MSGYVTGWILKHSEEEGATRLVLVVLADHASSDGTNAWPSVDTIQREARLKSRRTVQMALRRLEESGAIVQAGRGPKGETSWTVVVGGAPDAPAQSTTEGGASDDTGGAHLTVARVEPPLEPSREPSNARGQESLLPSPVEEVWDHYVERLQRPRAKLDPKVRKWIADAIEACGVEQCKRAISGLAVSEHHRQGGYLGIEYALKPKQGQTIQSRVEMMAAKAPRSAGGSTVVKDLLAAFTPAQREVVAGKMNDVRRRNMDPDSGMLKDLGDAAEEWLRVQANVVVVSVDGAQITWGRA